MPTSGKSRKWSIQAIFITGKLPIHTGLTTMGQPGAKVGIPKKRLSLQLF